MKFFVSAKWDFHETVAGMQDYLKSQGHEITADWTERAYARNYAEDPKQSERFSLEEIAAITGSDIFIHLSDLGGKGKYIDLGAAIVSNILNEKPLIYVIGGKTNESQHYFHQLVKRMIVEDITNNYIDVTKRILEEVQS